MIVYEDVNTLPEVSTVVYEVDNPIIDDELVEVDDIEVLVVNEAEDIHEVMRPTWQSQTGKVQMEFAFPVREKPLACSRFAGQRKLTAKVNPEDARSLRVSKPKKHETLESTWKTITDGRHIPLNRHIKKSDTFENHNQHEPKLDYNAMKKLETFNDRTDEVNDEMRDYGVAGDDYKGPLMFNYDQFEDELEMGDDAFVLIGKEESPNSKIPEAMFLIKPLSKKEQREFYMSVLRSHARWKTKHFRGMTLEEIKEKFIHVWKQIEDFVPMPSTEEAKRVKRKGLKFKQGSSKRIKTSEDESKEDLKGMMQVVPVEEALVKETLSIRQGSRYKEKELWVELKRLFEPNFEDQLWTHN
nr:hypothetical protein CTI12_AA402100 [Tanacetum cinerariifolium]